MARVLVVDDEPSYRTYLQKFLEQDGHEVRTAETGREAIALGTLWRPDVAILDWMLKADLHGLHVAAALRAVRPDTRIVLVTGFPSEDLRRSSEHLSDFLTKPFGPDQIRDSVARVLATPAEPPPRLLFPVIEVDADGLITYANPRALVMAAALGASDPVRLTDLFPKGPEACVDDWCEHVTDDGAVWHMRSQPPGERGRRLVVMCQSGDICDTPLVEIVLGIEAPRLHRPHQGRVLVVDDDRFYRMTVMTLIDQLGVPCYSAGTHQQALRLLETDPGLDLVILDFDMPDGDVGELVSRIRALRPGIQLVGNSGADRKRDFALRGVDRFLAKPWRTTDLLRLITSETRPPADPRESTKSSG